MLARIAGRLMMAPLGFVCGLTVGFVALAVISSNHFGDVLLFPNEVALFGMDLTLGFWTAALVLGPFIGAPAVVAVLIGELFAIRSFAYYALAGAATAVLPWAALPSGVDGPLFSMADIAACGAAAGLAHWLVAGRGAGVITDEPPAPPPPPAA
ncbi:hypothetical protein ACFQ4O_13950 [Methylopila musalis]|uniref:Uncharacterized protein n=1 Tax=Methylopila musalis TaxID=1134781 RepID=A0ABW3ZA81_9HYPH